MEQGLQNIMRAYGLLDDITPLPYDCGALCGRRCCRPDCRVAGSHAVSGERIAVGGMWLLPGERLLCDSNDFSITTLPNGDFLSCANRCDRKKRPFSCRIFPYFPALSKREDGSWRIRCRADPRGYGVCPLLNKRFPARVSLDFRRQVVRAARILVSDPVVAADLFATSAFLSDLCEMYEKFGRLTPYRNGRPSKSFLRFGLKP